VPSLYEFYPGICLTTEEKAWKNFSQGKKNLGQVKKNLSQSTVCSITCQKSKYLIYTTAETRNQASKVDKISKCRFTIFTVLTPYE
jgi:hypothetical protein